VCNKAVARTSIPDFIVGKVLIYCDGDYFHKSKKAQYRDKKINDKLTKLGYTVIRFTGTQINKDFIKVAKTITDTVNNNLT
jgi:very-short-patch-repair endonuclease